MTQQKRRGKKITEIDYAEIDEMYELRRNQIGSLQFKINCKFKNEKQKHMFNTIMNNRITFVRGAAGTGKTLIALLTALRCIRDNTINIDQIVLTKPIVEITSTKGLGALPGDINEKTLSYYTHFYDNLIKLVGNEATKYLKNNEIIKETILNYLRGSTFGRWDSNGNPIGSFCIFDEAQNCSIVEMKTFISRLGEDSKLVIMGDTDQVDLRLAKGEKCGLEDAWDRLQGIPGVGFVEFTEYDIVRDPFLIEIMKRYKQN
jgi:phosphate starvation-inducible protein PhoH and related proteins